MEELARLLVNYPELEVRDRKLHVDQALNIIANLEAESRQQQTVAAPIKEQSRQVSSSWGKPTPQPRSVHTPKKRPSSGVGIGTLSDSVQLIPSVGRGRAKQLEQLGVKTIRDLLYLYPRRYVDYSNLQKISELRFGQVSTIQAYVASIRSNPTRNGGKMVITELEDETGRINVLWFNPYIERQLQEGSHISISGRVDQYRGTLCFKTPEWESVSDEATHTGRIVPVYPLTKGLYQKTLRSIVRSGLDRGLGLIQDYLPQDTFDRLPDLISLAEAIEWVHFPVGTTPEVARQRLRQARERLAFDEYLCMQIGLLQRKHDWQAEPGNAVRISTEAIDRYTDSLPFVLTDAQRRTTAEILDDMASEQPMTRLLQGDVGSGKTAVAAVAAYAAIQDRYQVALMAPTELLAEQHISSLKALFDGLPDIERPTIGLITGSSTASQRRDLYDGFETGSIDIAVGTHALIQEPVAFKRLGLAIVDEQHRFGVEQRAALRNKGTDPDVLVMTATPIPRSLALTIYGDLDVSTLDELPPGRKTIETSWVRKQDQKTAYAFVRDQVERGRQAFIVFPLVEESEAIDAKAAVDEHIRLSEQVFPDLNVGLLHGRMKSADKDAIMLEFRDGNIDVLVATSVIEVGIDVPNATVMLIEGAERFGLSQLHQFRGRVGRGTEKSYCLLLATGDVSQVGQQRLEAMVDSQDGFQLAQIDLELRGPGDFLGTRQSGLPAFRLASFGDIRDLEKARAEAERILDSDPGLGRKEHALLGAKVDGFWATAITEVS